MSLSEKTRVELVRLANEIVQTNADSSDNLADSTRYVYEFLTYLVGSKVGIIRKPSPSFARVTKWARVPLRFFHNGIRTFQKLLWGFFCSGAPEKFSHSDNSTHSFKNGNAHNSSPTIDEQHPTDSHSEGRTGSVADDVGNHVTSLRAFTRTLTDKDLRIVADFGMPYWAECRIKTAARGEMKRRDALKNEEKA